MQPFVLAPGEDGSPMAILQELQGGGCTAEYWSPPRRAARCLAASCRRSRCASEIAPLGEHRHCRGRFGCLSVKSVSSLCLNILPQESSWQRWLCGDKCVTLPARASWGSASLRDSPKSAGTKVSVSHHEKPPSGSKKELPTLISPVHPHLGLRAAPRNPRGSAGAAAAACFPCGGGRRPSPAWQRAGSERPWLPL